MHSSLKFYRFITLRHNPYMQLASNFLLRLKDGNKPLSPIPLAWEAESFKQRFPTLCYSVPRNSEADHIHMSRRPSRQPRSSHGDTHVARQNQHDQPGAALASLSEDGLYQLAASKKAPFFLILDGVQDPHNLGACLRSADGAGVDAIITPKNKAARITDTVRRIACGGASYVPVVSVANLARCMASLRERHFVRIVGTSGQSRRRPFPNSADWPLAIALGAEESGLRRLTGENCDELIRIPMLGKVECLNVSTATAVCLFEAVRQRRSGQ